MNVYLAWNINYFHIQHAESLHVIDRKLYCPVAYRDVLVREMNYAADRDEAQYC